MFSENRLKEKRLQKGYSQAQMAKWMDISRTAYHHWESGKTKPNQANLLLLSQILSVPKTYFESEHSIVSNFLQLNTSNKLLAEEYVEDLLLGQQRLEENVLSLFPIQVKADIALSAGPGNSFFDEFETETVYSDQDWDGFDVATWIKGDSMEPTYQSGQVALIRESGFDYDGAVYAIVWNEEVFIKKVYLEEDGFRLVSLNKDYQDRLAPFEDQPKIVGKIIGHFMPVIGN